MDAKLKQYFSEGDPDRIFVLEEEIASGSFGAVYKVFFLPASHIFPFYQISLEKSNRTFNHQTASTHSLSCFRIVNFFLNFCNNLK